MELILIKDKKDSSESYKEKKKKISITISQKSWLIGIEFLFTTSHLASMRIDNPPFFWDK